MALPMNVSGLRRNIKNIAHNYTDAQVKVREATSNDPWGPSSTIMSEIADLTYNVVAFSEIMQMVWKRLNDHGKNWRHVYKALVLLEYLIKTGSEKVAEQSRENIHSISTLKDFQHIEEGKDQGINVREKAKAMVTLLKDEERLRSERVRALKAKERFAQSVSGIASDADINSPTSPSYHDTFVTSSSRTEREAYGVRERPTDYGELESARPHTLGEEELQLQLALAMSKEEADNEEARRRSDDVRLQLALNESKDEKAEDGTILERQGGKKREEKSGMNDLLDINFNPSQDNGSHLGAVGGLGISSPMSPPGASADPWGLSPPNTNGQVDPWGAPPTTSPPTIGGAASLGSNDPWSPPPPPPAQPAPSTANDPWAPVQAKAPADPWAPIKSQSPVGGAAAVPQDDPFAPLSIQSKPSPDDDFSLISTREKPSSNGSSFNMSGLEAGLPPLQPSSSISSQRAPSPAKSRSPAAFLGENSNLVNLENLVASKNNTPHGMGANPFSGGGALGLGAAPHGMVPNPFQAAQAPKPSINQLRGGGGGGSPWGNQSSTIDQGDPFLL